MRNKTRVRAMEESSPSLILPHYLTLSMFAKGGMRYTAKGVTQGSSMDQPKTFMIKGKSIRTC